jgi:putative tryptophan/tyrosine transport system substrate-binding protein
MSDKGKPHCFPDATLRRLCVCVALLACSLATAQPTTHLPRIGWVGARASWAETAPTPFVRGFLEGMREHAYLEGRDYVFEYRATHGDPQRFGPLTAELVHLPVDVLLVTVCGEPLNAARRATADIPIVVATCNDDMVETGIVKSMQRPGGNVTGLSKLTPELAAKRLSLLKQAVPSISRVAVLWNPDYSDFKADWRELEAAAYRMEVTLKSFEFRHADELDAAFDAMRQQHFDALITFSDVVTYVFASRIAQLASAAQLPAIYAFREVPDAGGLMSYGPSISDMWRRAADYVVRILKGAKPADMAIEQPARFEFVINVKTARTLGISVPRAVMLQADYVIE